MIIGVPKEIKDKEYRVGIVPAGVKALTKAGHTVLLESTAGVDSGIADSEYESAGATLAPSAQDVYERADLIMKVKEPLGPELSLLREKQIVFTYLHLAPAPELTDSLIASKIRGVAYETVQLDNGFLPLLSPMSQVAGRMAIQEGTRFLEKRREAVACFWPGCRGLSQAM